MNFHGFDELACDFSVNPSVMIYRHTYYTQKAFPQCVCECVL